MGGLAAVGVNVGLYLSLPLDAKNLTPNFSPTVWAILRAVLASSHVRNLALAKPARWRQTAQWARRPWVPWEND
jgi:hypothetical protein